MKAPSFRQRLLFVLLATVLLALSATMAWAAVNDFEARGRIPKGVTLAGTDLSGMTESQARTAIERAVTAPLMRPVSVEADGRTFSFDPRGSVSVDMEAMLAQAYGPRRAASYLQRVAHDLAGLPLGAEVEPSYAVDATSLDAWITGVARQIDRRAVDATLTVVDSKVRITRSATGRRVDRPAAVASLSEAFASETALAEGSRTIAIPVAELKPRVTERTMGKTIVVDLSQRKIRLFDGVRLEAKYPCAVGTPGFPTPKGEFEIVQKRYMPTWVNPAPNGWGADMPASIGPGPSNPLGTRALNLSASGIRFHGTTKIGSIGTAASHGCMRMRRSDIEDFYDRVKVGTKVYIVP